jgi:hypothetical protein
LIFDSERSDLTVFGRSFYFTKEVRGWRNIRTNN